MFRCQEQMFYVSVAIRTVFWDFYPTLQFTTGLLVVKAKRAKEQY